jgi:hypothetical protein
LLLFVFFKEATKYKARAEKDEILIANQAELISRLRDNYVALEQGMDEQEENYGAIILSLEEAVSKYGKLLMEAQEEVERHRSECLPIVSDHRTLGIDKFS